MFFLWTISGYTFVFIGYQTLAIFLLKATFTTFGLLPADTNQIYKPVFACLIGIYFLYTISPLTQAVTRIASQFKSFLTTQAPYMKRPGVKKMKSEFGKIKLWLPFGAVLRFGTVGAIFVAFVSFGIATLFSGFWAHAVGYAIASFVFYQLAIGILSNADVLGGTVNQLDKDAPSHYRNNALAESKEEKIMLQRMALEQSQEEHQQRLEEERIRSMAHKRDRARRRKDGLISALGKIIAFFR